MGIVAAAGNMSSFDYRRPHDKAFFTGLYSRLRTRKSLQSWDFDTIVIFGRPVHFGIYLTL